MCSYVVWLSHIQSVLGHYIEVEGFLCTFLVDDVASYLVAVGRLSCFETSILITLYESEKRVVCLENPWCSFGVDVLQCNHRTALWLTIIYLVAPISLVGIRKYHFCRCIVVIIRSSILPFLNGRSNGELAHLSVEEITINYQFSVSDGISFRRNIEGLVLLGFSSI